MGVHRDNIRETFTGVAGADLSGMEGRFIKKNADGKYILCSTAGERADGVLIKGRAEGKSINLVKYPGGTSNLHCIPGGLARNAELATDNMGRAKVAAAGEYVLALANEVAAASTEGEQIAADLVLYQKNP